MMSAFQFRGRPLTAGRIFDALQRRVYDWRYPSNSFHGVYGSFAEAAEKTPRIKPFGYDSPGAETKYIDKLNAVQLEDYPVLFWLRAAFEDSHSVFEVGGHIGIAYYGFAQVLSYPANLTWTICDVPIVAAAGEALARKRGRTNVRFVTAPDQSEGAEIVLAAGSLQYIESPSLAEMIAAFRVRPRHVLVNVTPVYDGPGTITLQSIGTAFCAYRVFNRKEFVDSLKAVGYSMVATWQKDRAFRIPGHPERSFDRYTGFYFRADEPGSR